MLQVQTPAALHKISPIWIMLTRSIQLHMESVVSMAVVSKATNGVVGREIVVTLVRINLTCTPAE